MVHPKGLILFLGVVVLCLGVVIASFVATFAIKLKHVKTCPSIHYGVKNAMVIVEPRKHKLLQPVIENFHQVDAENILVFQTDTVLCSSALTSIKDFLKFPYIGCSGWTQFIGSKSPWRGPFYGVGGLSFRKKSAMMSCINSNPDIDPDHPEDVFFSKCAHESPDRATDAKQLASFCTQYEFSENSFGAHKIMKNLSQRDLDRFLDYCPEANILLD